jgi:DNA repair exonuclease SbcCD ATPase subunit
MSEIKYCPYSDRSNIPDCYYQQVQQLQSQIEQLINTNQQLRDRQPVYDKKCSENISLKHEIEQLRAELRTREREIAELYVVISYSKDKPIYWNNPILIENEQLQAQNKAYRETLEKIAEYHKNYGGGIVAAWYNQLIDLARQALNPNKGGLSD